MAKNLKTVAERITDAVIQLHKQGIYPSAAKICVFIGRRPSTLGGAETKLRTELFRKIGIKKQANGSRNSDFEKSLARFGIRK